MSATTDPQPQSTADDPAPPPPSDDLADLVRRRRDRLAPTERPADDAGTWGLALSGGGIRSATFCFGLLKALAHNKVLHRFDLLSTVSGGGYIGSTIGKLFHNAASTGQSAKEIEEALADADTRWFAFWLRANGRYLIPRGGKDLLFAAANFSRNLVGVHIELALLCLLLGCLLVGVDLAVWQWADCLLSGNGCWQPAWVTPATLDALSDWPTLWVLLPPLLLAAASLATAYWALPATPGSRLPLERWIMATLCLLGCWQLLSHWTLQQLPVEHGDALQIPGWLLIVAGGMLCAWVVGTVIAQFLTLRHATAPDQSRHRLTAGLARVLNAILIVAALGLVDVMAWLLASARGEHQGAIGTIVMLTVVALRAVLPKIADLPRSLTPGTRLNLDGLINVAGVVTLAALLVFWVSVVHRSATFVLFDETRRVLQFALGWNWLAVIASPVVVMIGISFRNRDFLNRSSLYAFYRARLVRSYLGATNVNRFRGSLQAATQTYSRHMAAGGPGVSVQDVHAGDDVPLADYAPHEGGGPVHLINACVNQTRDPRGGLFNQDRKGLLMTVGPQGRVRVGQEAWQRMQGPDSLTLGSWVAISGAAVAPGLGSSTKSGIAALLTLSGVRLGYWWNAMALPRDPDEPAPRRVGKYAQLLGELRGRFDGVRSADWYLTDGGHFENTGAYALLREECSLVVVADCGADPRYAFADLENLVRKARIDLLADIVFLKPRLPSKAQPADPDKPGAEARENGELHAATAAAPPPPEESAPSVFGSLNDLVSTDSQACLALASIRYRSGKTGHLVVVKPNMCAGAPVDLVNYKADHPLFPQEPTTDQFFSETQWESYFQLGQTLGLNLQRHLLDDLPAVADRRFEVDDGGVAVRDDSGKLHAAAAPKRLPSRIAATGAVTASVSLGALATLGATAWQTVDQQMQTREKARRLDPAVLKELTDLYGKLMPDVAPTNFAPAGQVVGKAEPAAAEKTPTRLGEMATALLRIGDAACTLDNTEAFRRSSLMQMILTGTKQSCRDMSPRHRSCDVLLDPEQPVACLRERAQVTCAPRYWLRDFGQTDPAKQNCLVTPPPPTPVAVDPGDAATYENEDRLIQSPTAILEWLGLRDAKVDPPAAASTTGVEGGAPPASTAPPAKMGSAGPPAAGGGAVRAPAGAASTAQPLPNPSGLCDGKTVYIQIYGPELREQMRKMRQPWEALGANLPPMEDVWDSARRRGRAAPQAPVQPTVIYHDSASRACAEQLPSSAGTAGRWAVKPLSSRLTGTAGVIEVWIPPALTPTVGTPIAALPAQSFCYQEDTGQDGSQRYGVHCHADTAACEKNRGPNPRRVQSACMVVDTSTLAPLLNRRGFAGSWYAMRPQPFDAPFPQLP